MTQKSALESKTIWTNAILMLVGSLSPTIHSWISANPNEALAAITVLNMGLRFVSHGKISL